MRYQTMIVNAAISLALRWYSTRMEVAGGLAGLLQ